jgi:hypothetical protein
LLQNAQKRDKKIVQNNRGEKSHILCDEPRWIMDFFKWGKKNYRVFELPLLRNARKQDKKADKTLKIINFINKMNEVNAGSSYCAFRGRGTSKQLREQRGRNQNQK